MDSGTCCQEHQGSPSHRPAAQGKQAAIRSLPSCSLYSTCTGAGCVSGIRR